MPSEQKVEVGAEAKAAVLCLSHFISPLKSKEFRKAEQIVQRAIDSVLAQPETAYDAGRAAGDLIVAMQNEKAKAEKALIELRQAVRGALGPLPELHEGNGTSIMIRRLPYERLRKALQSGLS